MMKMNKIVKKMMANLLVNKLFHFIIYYLIHQRRMTLYMPQLNKLFEKAFAFIKERPALNSWLSKHAERYQDKMGHRKLGILFIDL